MFSERVVLKVQIFPRATSKIIASLNELCQIACEFNISLTPERMVSDSAKASCSSC